jgi:hypothetical protein
MKKFALLIIFAVISTLIYSQEDDFFSNEESEETTKPKRKIDNWEFGGNFWLSFGSNSAYVDVSPIVGYKVTPRLTTGFGFVYNYGKYNIALISPTSIRYINYETQRYGPKIYVNYKILTNIQEKINVNIGDVVVHSEYELINTEGIFYDQGNYQINKGEREWISNVLIGGGLFMPFSNRGGLTLLVLFDVTQHKYSPHANPVIRVGFSF